MAKRYGVRKFLLSGFYWILLILVVLWSVFPVYYVVVSSLKIPKNIWVYPPQLITFKPVLRNFFTLFRNWPYFPRALLNSLLITLGSIILTVTISLLAGYAYSRHRSKFLRQSAIFIIAIRMFPPIIISIPLYPILILLNLSDSHFTLIMLFTAFQLTVATWVLKAFFDTIPKEIEEAAMVDGCTQFQVFYKILIPLAAPAIVATSMLVAVYTWNEFQFAFLFTRSNAKTAPVLISEMMGSLIGVTWGQVFAASVIQLLPIMVFLWAIQKFLIKGITTGAVKG